MRSSWVGILGLTIGGIGAFFGRPQYDAWAKSKECCPTKHAPSGQTCPGHFENGKLMAGDKAEIDRLRRAMRDGVFGPWFELGRAPTPEEVGARLHLDSAATGSLLDQLEACGSSLEVGIRKVPESDLIAVAWPLANVPTGISVTLDGSKTVQARCAIDSLGISKMTGKRATVDAETRDGKARIHLVVDGDKLVSAEPSDAIVFKGAGCDEMLFFSSQAGLEAWKKTQHVEGGKVFTLAEAVQHGAGIFGKFTEGLDG